MKIIKGYVNEDLEIVEDTEIVGEVIGDVTVEDVTLVVSGSIKGTIYANEGSVLDMIGDCEEIKADASDVSISGTVFGDVIYRDTYLEIDENATIHGDVIDENADLSITRYMEFEEDEAEEDEMEESDDDDDDYYGVDDDDYDDDEYEDDFYGDDF